LWLLCGCAPAATEPAASPSAGGAVDAQAAAEPSPAVDAGAEAPTKAASMPLDLVNDCPKETRFYFGDDPADGKGQFATVPAGGTVAVPRGADGSVVVWVVGDRNMGLASVHVTRRMRKKHVRLDTACVHLDAD
jgi:hypothetical protein